MALFCFIYDSDFRNLVKEHELGAGEDQSVKVDWVLADPPYYVGSSVKKNHAEYDVFSANDMKDMTEVLGDVLKPRARGNMLYSDLQFYLLYNALASEKKYRASRYQVDGFLVKMGLRARRAVV